MVTVGAIYDWIDSVAPFCRAADFDNPGLLAGEREQLVTGVLLTLDLTRRTLEEAGELGASLILTHHPLIFHPVKSLSGQDLLCQVIRQGVAVISAHTNLDVATEGVSRALAGRLRLARVSPLEVTWREGEACGGFGGVGTLENAMEPQEFAAFVRRQLGSGVRYCPGALPVKRVAFCGGSGGSYVEAALQAGAQALVTGDVKHDVFLLADQLGLTLVDAGHFATENPVLEPLARRLGAQFPQTAVYVAGTGQDIVKWLV